MLESILEAVMAEKIGFHRKEILAGEFSRDNPPEVCLKEGKSLFLSPEYQIRCFAVLLLGKCASRLPEIVDYLRDTVSPDTNWRVQEMLGMAFAQYYEGFGYSKTLKVMDQWLSAGNPNLRRAVTEGLRPWHHRDYFQEHPDEAVKLLSGFKDDPSEYVRKSAGNALKDIGKKYPDLILKEVETWDLTDKKIRQTYQHALRLIQKKE